MNPTPQLDLHPDADTLNAFAEQALPQPERARILVHLAGCARCRQVLFLAQKAAADSIPAASPAPHSPIQPIPWFSNWRLALIPAVALAAIAIVAVVFSLHLTLRDSQLARTTPRQPESLSNAAASWQPPVAPNPEHIARPIAKKTAPSQPRAVSAEPIPDAAPAGGIVATYRSASVPLSTGQEFQAIRGPAPPGQQNNALQAWSGQRQSAGDTLSVAASPAKPAQARYNPIPIPGPLAGRSLSGSASVLQIESKSSPAASFEIAPAPSLHGVAAVNRGRGINLPSGLTAVSTAAIQHRLLAIDPAGTLFLSEDSGASWQPVPSQWTGHPVQVFTRQLRTATPVATDLQPIPAPVFELVNDSNLTWVSSDGKTWTAQ